MNARILVVDDNRALAEDVCELFELTNARVEICDDAHDAEASAEREPFDLAIVDLRLPRASGLELVPKLRELSPSGEVILITGSATLNTAIDAVRRGVFAYVPKPFDPEDLLRLGERALAQVALKRERTSLSRELTRSEALHRAVFDGVGNLILGIDERHRVRLWNRSAARTTGWVASEVTGRDAWELLFDEDQRAPMRAAAVDALAGHIQALRVPTRTRGGDKRIVRWQVRRLTPEESGSELVLLAGTDLTERLALEARAADAEAMAAMGRLTSSLAHEIRNPLNAATLQLELLRRSAKKLSDESIERRANIVAEELRRLTLLLDDFLGLARPRNVTLAKIDLGEVARAVALLHEPIATDTNSRLEVDVHGEPASVTADEGRLKQALINLVVNSLEALKDNGGGIIRLSVEQVGEHIELAVEDDGPGLSRPPGQVVTPFVTTKEAGTGLGLAVVTRVATMHGGSFAIGARVRGGTRAVISLPIEPPR